MNCFLTPVVYDAGFSPTFEGGVLFAMAWLKAHGVHDVAPLYAAYCAAEAARQAEIRRLEESHELPEFACIGYPEVPR